METKRQIQTDLYLPFIQFSVDALNCSGNHTVLFTKTIGNKIIGV